MDAGGKANGTGHGSHEALGNRILRAIPKAAFERLRPHLMEERLVHHHVAYHAGERIQRVYFVDHGLVSLVQRMRDGRSVEVGAVGSDGVILSSAIFGFDHALLDGVVQMPGSARCIALNILKVEATRCEGLSILLQGYVHLQVVQIAQTAACNRLHRLEQRCCRWLLIAHDNARGDSFPLTHEFLAMMLGVQRPGVTIAAGNMQLAGLIQYVRGQYVRGRITVTDRKGLEAASCECYATIRARSAALFATAGRA